MAFGNELAGEILREQGAILGWLGILSLGSLFGFYKKKQLCFFFYSLFDFVKRKNNFIFLFTMLLALGLGLFRVEMIRMRERETESLFLSLSQGKEKWQGFVLGTVESRQNQNNKEGEKQAILILRQVSLEDTKERLFPLRQKLRVCLEGLEGQKAEVGDRVKIYGSFALWEKVRNPGEWNQKAYYFARKVGFSGWGEELWVQTRGKSRERLAYRFREWAAGRLDAYLEERDSGILKAMLLGIKQDMDLEEKKLYQENGIAHILAISGLHLSLLGMGLWRVLEKCFVGKRIAGLCAGVAVFAYGSVVGMGSSVWRAALMFALMLGGQFFRRSYDLWSAWALAAVWLLWDSPRLLFDAGFQLSFGAIASIAGLGKSLLLYEGGKKRSWVESLVVSLAVQWGTLPILCYWYFEFPPYALWLNLLVLPCMAALLLSGGLFLLLASVCKDSLLPVLAAGPAHYILDFYHGLCVLTQKLPFARIVTGRPMLWKIACYYLLLLLVLFLLKRGQKERKGVLVLFGLSLFLLFPSKHRGLEVWFLDVGQGDGILIWADDHSILVDGGSSSNRSVGARVLEPCLKSLGLSQLDILLVTHGDEDHKNGAEYLLRDCTWLQVETVLLPKGRETEDCYEELRAVGGERVRGFGAGDAWVCQRLSCRGLHPAREDVALDRNNASIVFLLEYEGCQMLFTGDVEEKGEGEIVKRYGEFLREQDIGVLKVAHHGSKTSTKQSFLDCVCPSYAILSYGKGNRYGHPAEEILERLQKQRSVSISTAESGAICVRVQNGGRLKKKNRCMVLERMIQY